MKIVDERRKSFTSIIVFSAYLSERGAFVAIPEVAIAEGAEFIGDVRAASRAAQAMNDAAGERQMVQNIWEDVPAVRTTYQGAGYGEMFENILSHTDTYKDFEYIGARNGGSYPTIDFYDPQKGIGISVKTTQAKGTSFQKIRENITKLAEANDKGYIDGGGGRGKVFIDKTRLDIYVPQGYDVNKLKSVLNFAKQKNVEVNISTIESKL